MTKLENAFCILPSTSRCLRDRHKFPTHIKAHVANEHKTETERARRHVIVVTLGVPALVAEMVGARGAGAPALSALGQRQKLQALGVHLAIVPQVVSNCKQGQFGLQLKVIVAM